MQYARIPYHFQRLHNGLNSSIAWWTVRFTGCKNNLKHISTQKMVTFNNCCNVACLKFKLPCDKTTGYLRTIHFFKGSKCKFHQRYEFCISQGTVATFFRCGGQVQKYFTQNYFRILCAKNYSNRCTFHGVIQKIKMWPLFGGTHCRQ